jgi:hypothetical protein
MPDILASMHSCYNASAWCRGNGVQGSAHAAAAGCRHCMAVDGGSGWCFGPARISQRVVQPEYRISTPTHSFTGRLRTPYVMELSGAHDDLWSYLTTTKQITVCTSRACFLQQAMSLNRLRQFPLLFPHQLPHAAAHSVRLSRWQC